MVLADLGSKLSGALAAMSSAPVIDDSVVSKLTSTISLALLQSDVDIQLVKQLQSNIKSACSSDKMPAGVSNKRKFIQSTVISELYNLLDAKKAPFQPRKGKQNVIMFVGLQGSGKTTSCTKYAYYYKRKGWKVALVCADTYRAGAFDQLKQNATKAKIPFYGSYTERDPSIVAGEGVKQFKADKYDIIIVDTSGRHKQESALFEEMKAVERVCQPDDIVFVMDSSIGQAAKDQAAAFKSAVSVGSVIITKLDGHAKGGGALSAVAATQSPILFIGTGEHIDDFEAFQTKSFVSRLLGMGDITGLLDMFTENQSLLTGQSQQDLMNKIVSGKGEFTFRDMRDQFNTLLSLGPLGKIMAMIPGLNQLMAATGAGGKDAEKQSVDKIKRFMCIMDSFTQQELDSTDAIFAACPNRINRIARGSGTNVRQVCEVVNMIKPFKGFASKMKAFTQPGGMQMPQQQGVRTGTAGRGTRQPGRPSQPGAGPGGLPDLSSMLPPGLMQQMGGAGGLQSMMKNMMGAFGGGGGGAGGAGGMPDMSQLMSMMGGGGGGGGGNPLAAMMQQMGGGGGGMPGAAASRPQPQQRQVKSPLIK